MISRSQTTYKYFANQHSSKQSAPFYFSRTHLLYPSEFRLHYVRARLTPDPRRQNKRALYSKYRSSEHFARARSFEARINKETLRYTVMSIRTTGSITQASLTTLSSIHTRDYRRQAHIHSPAAVYICALAIAAQRATLDPIPRPMVCRFLSPALVPQRSLERSALLGPQKKKQQQEQHTRHARFKDTCQRCTNWYASSYSMYLY